MSTPTISPADRAAPEGLRLLENIGVKLTVEVGRAELTIRDLLRLSEGSVIELDRLAGDPLDVLVNDGKMVGAVSHGRRARLSRHELLHDHRPGKTRRDDLTPPRARLAR